MVDSTSQGGTGRDEGPWVVTIQIATGRYANPNVKTCGLAPVGITQGLPKFPLGYQKVGHLYDLAPRGWMLSKWRAGGWDMAGFNRAYVKHLDSLGPAKIIRQLTEVSAGWPGVVLLCYEDVTIGEPCHRRTLADWFLERTGIEVPEIPDLGKAVHRAPKPEKRQGTLF